jgi:hypothetical protein
MVGLWSQLAIAVSFPALCASCALSGQDANPADTPSAKGGTRSLQLNPMADPNSPGIVRYAATLSSSPLPSPPPHTTVTRDAAIAIAQQGQSFGSQMQPGNPVAALRLVTLSEGPTELKNQPAWVLTWNGSKPRIMGGPMVTNEQRQEMAAHMKCIFLVIVDANSAEAVDARQICVSSE